MEIFIEIIKLYDAIKKIYSELLRIALDGNKNSKTFNELIAILKYCFKKEDELFRSFIDNYNNDYVRINQTIKKNSYIYGEDIKNRMLDYLIIYKTLYSDSSRIDKLYMFSYRNMYLIYCSFLQECIDMEIGNDLKKGLLELKYNDAFVNHDIESILVLNNYIVPVYNYVDLDIVNDIVSIDNGYEVILEGYFDIILGSLVDLLDIKDSDYNDNSKMVLLIKNQCMLRACMSLISDKYYSLLIEVINNIINDQNYGCNMMSIELINSILDHRLNDKERVRRLSLKY